MTQYLIDDSEIQMIEEECFMAGKLQEGQNKCERCKYEPKSGPRKGCCDFGKSEMIATLRARPFHQTPTEARRLRELSEHPFCETGDRR